MSGTAIALLVVGGFLQLLGTLAIAWPDMRPWMKRASAWLSLVYRRIENRMRRLFGRPPREQIVYGGGAVAAGFALRGAAVLTVAAEASMERKVAFLLHRDQEAQQKENAFASRLDDLEEALTKRLDELRSEMRKHHEQKLAEALDQYRALRILGAVLLAIGIACQVAAGII